MLTLPDDASVREGLVTIGRRVMQLITGPVVVAMWCLLIGGAASHARIAAMFLESSPRVTVKRIKGFLERHVRLGKLDIDDLKRA